MRLVLHAAVAATLGVGAVAAAVTPAPQAGAVSRAPYDGPPAPNVTVTVTLDLRAAKGLLELLSAPHYDPGRAKELEALPAVETAIRESRRGADVFEKDLASAWDEKARTTLFDFHRIREESTRWKALVGTIEARQAELGRLASDRARALMPGDRPVSVRETILLTFGLPGRADHVAVPSPDGSNWSVVADIARTLSDEPSSDAAEQLKHLSRMVAQEAFRRAWAEYRAGSPAWQKHDASLGQLEPLLSRVAEAGPVALYSVDENFFPLSVWLKQPMKDSIDEVNRYADRVTATGGDLDARMEIAAEIQKPDFMVNLAGPSGAFLSDGIVESLGVDGFRSALSGGPRAFFEAYDRASQKKGSGLVPLSKAIRHQLSAGSAPKKG
ncbi:MAG: hypothetical protein ACM3NW_01215 [Syntrophomonadaceae bacterium]